MKINLDHYLVGKSFIQSWFLKNSKDDPSYAISMLACVTHTPIVVVCFYISEVHGWSQETLEIADKLVKFYKYEEVLGLPEGCPWRLK